jgi:hypothetical protein
LPTSTQVYSVYSTYPNPTQEWTPKQTPNFAALSHWPAFEIRPTAIPVGLVLGPKNRLSPHYNTDFIRVSLSSDRRVLNRLRKKVERYAIAFCGKSVRDSVKLSKPSDQIIWDLHLIHAGLRDTGPAPLPTGVVAF